MKASKIVVIDAQLHEYSENHWTAYFDESIVRYVNYISIKLLFKINRGLGTGGSLCSELWEAEAGELLEPRRQWLQWAETVPLYSSLDDRARLHLKKQNKTKQKTRKTKINNKIKSNPLAQNQSLITVNILMDFFLPIL